MTKLADAVGRKYIGVPEFAAAAAAILDELGLVQERGTVTDVPDERTIRYYLSEGLIQSPEEKQGTASVFGHLHLLQLLAVKKLQAEHLPIRKIRELVAGRSERELERLIGFGKKPGNEAVRYLQSLLSPPSPAPSMSLFSARNSVRATEENRSWERIEIEPGLELHIRTDYKVDSKRTRGLIERIIRALATRRKPSDKEK